MKAESKRWLIDTIDRLPKFRLCQHTGERVTGDKCPEHGSTECVFLYVNVTTVLEKA